MGDNQQSVLTKRLGAVKKEYIFNSEYSKEQLSTSYKGICLFFFFSTLFFVSRVNRDYHDIILV